MTNDSDEKERDWALEHWRKILTAYLREDENNRDEGSQALIFYAASPYSVSSLNLLSMYAAHLQKLPFLQRAFGLKRGGGRRCCQRWA